MIIMKISNLALEELLALKIILHTIYHYKVKKPFVYIVNKVVNISGV